MKALTFCLSLWAGAAAAQSSVQVTGMVAHSEQVVLDALKQVSVDATFQTMNGPQSHRWSGPLLLDVVNKAGIENAPGQKTYMRHVILAQGSDGYAAAVAIGELDGHGQGKQVIVALTQDDKKLPRPRLVVPGDASFARGVHDLSLLEVK